MRRERSALTIASNSHHASVASILFYGLNNGLSKPIFLLFFSFPRLILFFSSYSPSSSSFLCYYILPTPFLRLLNILTLLACASCIILCTAVNDECKNKQLFLLTKEFYHQIILNHVSFNIKCV